MDRSRCICCCHGSVPLPLVAEAAVVSGCVGLCVVPPTPLALALASNAAAVAGEMAECPLIPLAPIPLAPVPIPLALIPLAHVPIPTPIPATAAAAANAILRGLP